MRHTNPVSLFTLLSIAIPADCIQIPFLIPSSPPQQQPLPQVFQLQHAVHIPASNQHPFRLRRDFTSADRDQIDIRSAANQPGSYASYHGLKAKRGAIWTHRATFHDWELARQRQAIVDRALRNAQNVSAVLLAANLSSPALEWESAQVELPDVADMETLASLAKMTNNAYTRPGDDRWYDPGGHWNVSHSFGWEHHGLRGHVFATPDNGTIVIAIKGTSAGILGNGGSTGVNDKLNDNLFFSCCCARISWSWSPVCNCYAGPDRCRESCVENALVDKSVYFTAAVNLYNEVATMYPHAQIWLSGHSLGAALAGLLGITFGVPVVGFEAPGDLLPAKRLHLPLPPGGSFGAGREQSAVTHVFHTADPIAMGSCNGALSTCSVAGYALETRCHIGEAIIFDTVGKLNWAVDIRTHPIQTVIDKVLKPDWIPEPPECNEPPKSSFQQVLRWPWSGDKDKNKTCGDEPAVPRAEPQECEGECGQWDFRDSWDDEK